MRTCRMHVYQFSGIRGRLYFVLIGQQKHWRNCIRMQVCLSLCCSHIYVIIHKYLAHLYVKCEDTKTYLACGSNN